MNENLPFFSVIIPTRNKPKLLKKALESVLNQDFVEKEILIINDGDDKHFEDIGGKNVSIINLLARVKGHGASYVRNFGAELARGQFLCFLDDDDFWLDKAHLSRAFASIMLHQGKVDAYFTKQQAVFSDGQIKQGAIWLEAVFSQIQSNEKDSLGNGIIMPKQLIKIGGFSHLNCLIIRRAFFEKLQGFDESLRYEEDRDLYLRVLDSATHKLVFSDNLTAQHNIPNRNLDINASTQLSSLEKYLNQWRIYSKGVALSQRSELKERCQLEQMFSLKKIAEHLYNNKEYKKSALFSRQALSIRFSLKWFVFSAYLSLRAKIKPAPEKSA